jgi:hypothetical protein
MTSELISRRVGPARGGDEPACRQSQEDERFGSGPMTFALLVAAVGGIGGVMAALSDAGIGSTLVPLFAVHVDFKIAVAAAAVPHLAGSALRAYRLRQAIDWPLLRRFGIVCAASSFVGALLHGGVTSPIITYVFAGLLVLAGGLGLMGVTKHIRLGRRAAWLAGAGSGFFGGLAGEQGGLRAVALLGFHLGKEAFVATGTAVAVVIDVVRVPVYLFMQHDSVGSVWHLIVVATAGVVAGTWAGAALLGRLPERRFGQIVSGIILVIGALLFMQRHD